MRNYPLILALALFAQMAVADSKPSDPQSGGGAQDLLGVTKTPDFAIAPHERSRIRSMCENEEGRQFYPGEPQYDDCIKSSKNIPSGKAPPDQRRVTR